MGSTANYALTYPSDYDAAADVPAAMQSLALSADAALLLMVPKAGGTMSGNLTVPTATASGHAVTKAQMDSGDIPVGGLVPFAGTNPPANWMLCNGQAVLRNAYPTLFSAIGTAWGAGDGSTTFNLPDFRGKVPVGLDATQAEFNTLAKSGGSKTSVAPHTHPIDHDHGPAESGVESATHYHGTASGPGAYSVNAGYEVGADPNLQVGALTVNTGTESTTHTHTTDLPPFGGTSGAASAATTSGNLQPYGTVNFIIRAA